MEGVVFAFCSSPALSTTVPQAYLSEAVALSKGQRICKWQGKAKR